MYRLFIGTNAFNCKQVGCIDDYEGSIYQGQSCLDGKLVGKVELPYVFSINGRSKEKNGRYSQGNVYRLIDGRETLVGSYDGEYVYKGSGWNRQQIGRYEGSAAGAAALLLLFE